MLNITDWLDLFVQKLTDTFGSRVWFAGLQGSYARGEATADSDIDVVVILDQVRAADIATYNAMLSTLPNRDLVCGFFSGKEELLSWEPADLFQFYFDTKPICGNLDCLLQLVNESTVRRAIKIGAGNIYHGCVHNMLHRKSDAVLRDLYKAAVFTVQAICYLQTGRHICSHRDLLNAVSCDERRILEIHLALKRGDNVRFQEMSEILFIWAQKWIINT